MVRSWINQTWAGLEKSIAITVVLLAWELLPRIGWISSKILPPFSVSASKFWQMIISGELMGHIAISFERAFWGLALSVIIAIPLGFLLGWYEKAERIIDPVVQLSRNTATLAMYPLFIIIFGLGESAKVAIIFWGAVWPLLINTIEGVQAAEPLLIKAARSMGASQFVIFFKVILPSAFPSLFTGIRLSASRAVVILVAAEMVGANSGLGYLVFFSEANNQIATMYTAIMMLIILGVIVNYTFVTLEKRLTRWKEEVGSNV